mgnify:CR=1 FL=1
MKSDTSDEKKTKAQLTQELRQLRQRVTALQMSKDQCERAKEALRVEKERFEHLFGILRTAIVQGDEDGQILRVNDEFTKMFGYTFDDVVGRQIDDLIAPHHLREEAALITEQMAKGGKVARETVRRCKDGTLINVSLFGSPFQIDDESMIIYAIYRDDTGRKRAEKIHSSLYRISEAANTAQSLQELFHSIHDIVGELMPADNFYIALQNLDDATLEFPYFVDEYDDVPSSDRLEKGLTEYLLRTEEPLLAPPDVYDDLIERGEIEHLGAPAIDWLGVPLKAQEETIGALVVQSYTEGVRFGEKEKDLLLFVSAQIAMAIRQVRAESERERLLAALQRRSAQLQTAAEVSRAASSILDLNELIQQVVDLVRQRFGLYYAGLFLVDRAEEWAVLQAGTGEAGQKMLERGHKLEIGGASMIGWCIAHKRARIALDVGEDAVRFDNPLLPETRSELALPLASRDQVIGALTIQSAREAAFSEEDIVVLQTMADQLANAIQNARLFEETHSRAERLALLNRIARAAGATFHLDDLLEMVYQSIIPTFQADIFFIALYDEGRDELDFRFVMEEGSREHLGRTSLSGLTSLVVAEKKPLLVRDSEWEQDHLPEPVLMGSEKMVASWLGAPMLIGERVIGVINVQAYHPYAYGEEEQRLLTTIADQMSVVVERARLYEQARQEIAERKRAEERYRTLVAQAPIGVITCDREGRVTHVNPALLDIVPGAEGHQFNLLNVPGLAEAGIAADVRRCMDEAIQVTAEHHYRSPEGRESIMRLRLTPLRGENGAVRGALATVEDVTEQRRLQEQLIQSAKLASIGELAAGVAHEINNPINGIINYAQLLLNKAESDSRQAHFMKGILREGDRVANIVRDLLTFARVEKEAHSPAHVRDILQATLTLTGQQLKKDGILLEIQEQPDLPQIKCRSQRIQQVFLNLISNARDALNTRYPDRNPDKRLLVRILQVEKEGESYVRAIFRDQGMGIPASDLPHVFTPFFTTKRPGSGTGLGLSVSYGIIQSHHGDIQVESVVGEHTTFRVDLPVDPGWEI